MARTSLAEYVAEFRRNGRQTAYVHRRGYRIARWSYRQVADAAAQFARELEARGVGKGERVVIWGDNSAEWVVAFFGCVLRGVVVVPMDRIASCDFMRRVHQQVEARLLVCSRELLAGADGLATLTLEELTQICERHSREPYASPELARTDTLQVVFTSGTTAEPKGVVISHGNVLANLEPLEREIAKYRKYERVFHPIRFLNLLPLSHVFGQFLGIFVPHLIAGTVVFQDTLNPAETLRTIKRERVSVLISVPRLLESLRDKVERDLESEGRLDWFREQFRAAKDEKILRRMWRFRRIHRKFGWKFWAFISGGAALERDTEEFWRTTGFAVIQGYGLTETTSLISVNHPFKLGKGSIGKVLPGRELKLDPESGEILVRGDNVASGYWQGHELKPVLGGEGWFRTGDLGEVDAEGNLYFKGRLKDVIVTPEGMNIHPEDLEAALRRQPEVRDCVVAGLQRGGNAEPVAVLLLREGDAAEVVRRANSTLSEFQHMRRWMVWPGEDFPRTSTQKVKTAAVQQAVQQHFGAEAAAGTAPPSGGLGELIGRITGRAVELRPDAELDADLNLSSVDRVELQAAIEDRYQVDISEGQFSEAKTVAEVEKLLHRPAAPRVPYVYPRWAQRWPHTWIRFAVYHLLTWPATKLLTFPRVIGRENLEGVNGPLLVVSNHVEYFDIGFLLFALPLRLRSKLAVAMQGERLIEMRYPPKTWALWWRVLNIVAYRLTVALFNVFPLPQRSGFRESFAFAGESVDRGYSIAVFPEGGRTQDGLVHDFRSGIGLLVNRLDIPVLPMKIEGLYEVKKEGWRVMAPPSRITVKIGKPEKFQADMDPELIAKSLQEIVEKL